MTTKITYPLTFIIGILLGAIAMLTLIQFQIPIDYLGTSSNQNNSSITSDENSSTIDTIYPKITGDCYQDDEGIFLGLCMISFPGCIRLDPNADLLAELTDNNFECEEGSVCCVPDDYEDCANEFDDDADGNIDCCDSYCTTYETTDADGNTITMNDWCDESIRCDDEIDNDCDGNTDMDDEDCSSSTSSEEIEDDSDSSNQNEDPDDESSSSQSS